MDRGIKYQQNLTGVDLCLIVLSAVSNDIDDLLPLTPAINAALQEASPCLRNLSPLLERQQRVVARSSALAENP